MSKKGGGWLVAALVIGVGYLIFRPTDESIAEAASKGHVAVDIRADDETRATFTVRRLSGASGNFVTPSRPLLSHGWVSGLCKG